MVQGEIMTGKFDRAWFSQQGKMLTQKGIVSTSDSMCAEAHKIMVKC